MKRRNADCGKLRRPIKRNKITEGMYGSTTVLYMKFLVLWAIVITADFMFMFRFEFLWPFWLLLRSVHDSFKYKGLAFSVLFVCIAITSDLVCLFFIPVHWLLFAASTYVWVQYVWHTDKGICLPTIILWMLFVYLEAGIRWKDSRHMPHLDLCRPFAAHCIGYPVVTLGFGFKSYVGYRIRQRKQRDIARENDFYYDLLRKALPPDAPSPAPNNDLGVSVTNQVTLSSTSTAVSTTTTTSAATTAAASTNANHLCAQNSIQLSNLNILNNSDRSTNTTSAMPNGLASAITNTHQHNHSNYHNQQQQQNHTSHQPNGPTSNHLSSNGPNSHHHQNNNNSNHNSGNSISTSCNHGTATAISTNHFNATSTTRTTNQSNLTSSSSSALNDEKNYESLNANNGVGGGGGYGNNNNNSSNSGSNFGGGATANGQIGGGGTMHASKSQRRSADKDHKNRNGSTSSSSANETECKRKINNSNNNNNLHVENHTNNNNSNNYNFNGKDKVEFVEMNGSTSHAKDRQDQQRDTTRKSNTHPSAKVNSSDGHQHAQSEMENVVAIEPVEKSKGRRNRSKKDNAATKDNQQHGNNLNLSAHTNHNSIKENCATITPTTTTTTASTTTTANSNARHHNSDTATSTISTSNISTATTSTATTSTSSSSLASTSTFSTTSLTSTATSAISNIASKVVSKICESCLKFEADIKKYRSEISHMKQIENELRQKLESNLTTKNCLQAKQKECEELEKRILELTNARHADYKASERRITEERRQKQSLEAQLNNEKKARKIAEEKAARPECSQQCKQRKQQMDEEIKQLRRDLKSIEEAKLHAEQHGRKYEQELRMLEAEIRNRDSNQKQQQPTEMLMNALAAMQDKNCTLEKNLSAETRVKLDLFSALGDAKRQLEISESRRRSKDDEVLDLKAKIAQLLAVMPTDTLCLPTCGTTSAGSMLQCRMNDTPPLKNVNGPTGSPLLNTMVNVQASTNVVVQQQHQQQQAPTSPGDYAQQAPPDYCSGLVPVSVANAVLTVSGSGVVGGGASSLDPNATVYTPKTMQNAPGGGVVVVGGLNGDA